MSETLYATFADPNQAHTATAQLVELGLTDDQISLLVKDDGHVRVSPGSVDLVDTRPTTPMQGESFNTFEDPTSNRLSQSSVARIERGLDVDVASNSPRVEGEANDTLEGPDSLLNARGFNAISEDSPALERIDPDAEGYRDSDSRLDEHADAGSVAKGVAVGAGIGLGVGAAAALATLFVPGVGLVVGAGAIAAASTALAATATTGAIAGGVAKLLRDGGVPEERAEELARTYEDGHAVLAVSITDPNMKASVEDVLHANRCASIESHSAYLA